ncbi:hypothetical protein BGZ93_005017 [Podila epicladia]|nr:hypothetical protein BGZ93_005017 [Podila epicladia]
MSSSTEYALELSTTTTPLGFNRLELVRLMVQSLQGLGYHQAAQTLETESGYQLESPAVSRFRECVLSGNWTEVEQLTSQLNLDFNHGISSVKFLIREQKFLELLEARQIKSALVVLRSELTPLNQNMDRVHALTSYMMSSSPEDLRQRAGWDGVEGQSRQKLLTSLQKLISPSIMVPENRLENMLQQAVELQVNNCLYHDIRNDTRSLYSDHLCDKTGIPSITRKVLEEHTNEVWYVSFSHDGRFLASASADSRIIIWNVQTYEPVFTLQGHTNKVSCCAWSPDDTKILSTGLDRTVKLWDVQTETLLKSFQKHSETINCLAWLPEGDRFVSGCEKKMLLMNDQGDVRYSWPFPVRDVAVSPDGRTLIAMGGTIIRIISLDDMSELNKLEESDSITAISLSRDGRYLLANTTAKPAHPPQQREIHLWNLEEGRIERRYVGHKQGRYIIRSCFGGWGDRFVISGSEDSTIYIWHRDNGNLVQTLEGHTRPVTCVAWSPIHPTMLVSASDDNTIRIWGTSEDSRVDQALVDGAEQIPQETLDHIPVEVWVLILAFVPPARLAILTRVCRQWQGIIQHQLPLWSDIAIKCSLREAQQQGFSMMELVLGHALVICELCLEASRKGVGSDLPLPVDRQDALGKTWMCRPCRRQYYTRFPEPTRQALPRDYDSVPSPLDPEDAQDGHKAHSIAHKDEIVLARARALHGGDIGILAHQSDDYNTNHLLRRRRRKMLATKLMLVGLNFRSDSKLCGTYLRGSWYDPGRVAAVMKEMEWYYAETSYWDFMNEDFESAVSKTEGLAEWVQNLVRDHGWGARETYKAGATVGTDTEDEHRRRDGPRLLPPPSLWPLIDGWLQHMFEHMGGSEDMDLWDQTYRPDPGAFTISIETDDEEE